MQRRTEDNMAARCRSDQPTLLLQGGVGSASRGSRPACVTSSPTARDKLQRRMARGHRIPQQASGCTGDRTRGRRCGWFICYRGAHRLGGTGWRTRPMTTIRDLLGHGSAWRPALMERRSCVPYCAVLIPRRTKPLHLEAALAGLLAQHVQGSMTQHYHILGHRQYGCDWRPRETSHPTPNAGDSRCLNGCAPACSLVPHHHLT